MLSYKAWQSWRGSDKSGQFSSASIIGGHDA
jgi:hypothetical protein